jgi:hypothetical protein
MHNASPCVAHPYPSFVPYREKGTERERERERERGEREEREILVRAKWPFVFPVLFLSSLLHTSYELMEKLNYRGKRFDS